MREVAARLLRFALVGSIGFAVDATVLQLLVIGGCDAYLGRLASYLCAATVTWALNRRFTFPMPWGRPLHREWTRYVAINGIGAAINYAVYAACLLTLEVARAHLALAVAAGSLASLGFNFSACNRWLAADRAPRPVVAPGLDRGPDWMPESSPSMTKEPHGPMSRDFMRQA